MMDKNISVNSAGCLSFSSLLTIVFIVLKLTHVIEWNWIWVLSPLWIGMIIAVLIIAIALIVFFKTN